MPSETINGTSIFYEESGTGPPMVLIHGFPLDSSIFTAQRGMLADQFRVITPDLRGFGKSKSLDPFTLDTLAEDVHALLARIGALPCALGGLSMGGYVALAYVKKFAGDLSGFVLIDTKASADTDEGKAGRNKMIDLVRSKGSKAVAEQMLPKMLTAKTLAGDETLVARVRTIMENCPATTIENALTAMRDRPDCTPVLSMIVVPTVIICGEMDPITPPKLAEEMSRIVIGSKLAIIPGAAHLSTMEQPGAVNDALRLLSK